MDYSLCLLINNKDNKNITKGRRRNFRFLPFVFLAYNSYISYIRSGKDEKVEQLSSHLYLIDDFDLQHNERTGTYVLLGDDITLIETCAAPSLPYILDGLQQLHIDLNEVKNIIVTHVHLDHAGAAGLMMEKCPNATLYVHSRGARHMIDPTKLILGAKAVYKEDFDKLLIQFFQLKKNVFILYNMVIRYKLQKTASLHFMIHRDMQSTILAFTIH